MIQKIFYELKKIDKITYKIIKYGLMFSFFVALVASSLLLFYIFSGTSFFYHIGLVLLKTSLNFAIEFIVCGIIIDSIKKAL